MYAGGGTGWYMDLFTNHSKPCSIGQKHSHCLANYSNSVVIGYPGSQTTTETTDNRYIEKPLPESPFVCSCFDDCVEFIVDLLRKKIINYRSRRSGLSEGGLFSVRYWLGFQEISSYSDQDKLKFIENVWKPGGLFDFPSSVECSNSNCHFVWSWLKRIPWLIYSKYLDGAFCLPCVFFGVQCGRNANKLDKLYKSPLTLWTSAISHVTKQASGKCEMHNLADLNLDSHAILVRLV